MTNTPSSYPSLLRTMPRSVEVDGDVSLAEIGRTIRRRWRMTATITIIVTAIALLYVLYTRPEFAINGSLYLGEATTNNAPSPTAASSLGFLNDFQSVSNVETQIQLIKARALVEKAILQTGLNTSVTPKGAHNLTYWRWRLLHGGQISSFQPKPGDLEALYTTFSSPVSGTKNFQLIIGQNDTYRILSSGKSSAHPKLILTGTLGKPASGGGLSLFLKPLDSESPPNVGRKFILKVTPAQLLASTLIGGALTVTAGGTKTNPTQNAKLRLLWNNPYQGKKFLNQLMNDFIATQLSWKTEAASATENFISSQLRHVQKALATANKALATYQGKTGVLDVPTNAKAAINELSQYEVQRTNILIQQKALEQLAKEIDHPSRRINPYLVSQSQDPSLGRLAQQLAGDDAKLRMLRVQFTRNDPKVIDQAATVYNLSNAIKSMLDNDLSSTDTNLKSIDKVISKLKSKIRKMPFESLRVAALSQSSDVYGKLYVLLMEKQEEAEVSKAASIINTRIVSPAQLPLGIFWPKAKFIILAGLLFGLFISVAAMIIRRSLSMRFQSDSEVRRLAPLPIYGLIPRQSKVEQRKRTFTTRSHTPFFESFRLLRSNLYQSDPGQRSNLYMITSASRGDGKTIISANLAKALADDGKSVVLVDADLHRGRIHDVLGFSQAPGFAEWLLTGQRPPLRSIRGQRFQVLTSGAYPLYPSELLNSPSLEKILDQLKLEFDFVLVDCPALPAVSDSMSLGRYANLILSIVQIEHTPRDSFAIHYEMLATLGRHHGVIINGLAKSACGYGRGRGYGKSRSAQKHREHLAPVGVHAVVGER